MSILDDLEKNLIEKPITGVRKMCFDGLLSIHDVVFKIALKLAGVDEKTIDQLMIEPVEYRASTLEYYNHENNTKTHQD
jgi:hypothetical protein